MPETVASFQRVSGRSVNLIIIVLFCGLCLSACGKKPTQVDSPTLKQEDMFPRSYPDPATDPKPN